MEPESAGDSYEAGAMDDDHEHDEDRSDQELDSQVGDFGPSGHALLSRDIVGLDFPGQIEIARLRPRQLA